MTRWPRSGKGSWLRFGAGTATGVLLVGAVFAAASFWPEEPCPRTRAGTDVLTVAGGADISAGRQVEALIEGWPGRDGIKARFLELPGLADLQHAQLAATVQDGGCAADVYLLDLPWVAEFARGGHLAPLEGDFSELLDAVVPGALRASGEVDETQFAVPFNADVPLLYYRKDLIPEERDIPRSWPQLQQKATDLLRAGVEDPDLKAGYAAQLAPYEGFTVNALELISASGPDLVVRADNSTAIDADTVSAIVEGLTRDVAGDAGPARTFLDPGSLGWHEEETTLAFRTGRTVFMRNWPAAYVSLARDLGPEEFARKYGVAAFPGTGVLGGQALAVAARTPHREAAEALLRHLTGTEAQHRLFWCGGFAPVRSALYFDDRGGTCPDDVSGDAAEQPVRHVPWELMGLLHEEVEDANARPDALRYSDFSRVLREVLWCRLDSGHACGADGSSAKAFTAHLNARLTAALRGR